MKQHVKTVSLEEMRRWANAETQVEGWAFRIDETSTGVYLVEGRDRFGRVVSRHGTDPDELLAGCWRDARHVQRQLLRFASNDEFYACIDLLCVDLAECGFAEAGTNLRTAIQSGATAGEVFGLLRQALLAVAASSAAHDPSIRERVEAFVTTLDGVLGNRWRG